MKPTPLPRGLAIAGLLAFIASLPLGAQSELEGQSPNSNSLQRMMRARFETDREIPLYDQHIQHAYTLLAEGNFNEAYRYLNYAIKEDPDRADAYVGFAIASRAKKQYPAAERALRKALAVEPDNPRVRHELARLLLLKQVPEEALTEIDHAIRLDGGTDWKTQQVRAEVLVQLDRIPEAVILYTTVEQLVEAKLGHVRQVINSEQRKEEIVSMGTEYELVNDLAGKVSEIEVMRFDTAPKDVPAQWLKVRARLERDLANVQQRAAELARAAARSSLRHPPS